MRPPLAIGATLVGTTSDTEQFNFFSSAHKEHQFTKGSLATAGTAPKQSISLKELRLRVAEMPERKKITIAVIFTAVAALAFIGAFISYTWAADQAAAELVRLQAALRAQNVFPKKLLTDMTISVTPSEDQVLGRVVSTTLTKVVSIPSNSTVDATATKFLAEQKKNIEGFFTQQIGPGERLLPGLAKVTITSAVPSSALGAKSAPTNVTITLSGEALLFKMSDLDLKVRQKVATSRPGATATDPTQSQLTEGAITVRELAPDASRALVSVEVYPQGLQ